MSDWTHPQCERCWIGHSVTVEDDGTISIRKPTRTPNPEIEICCWCQHYTVVGIYRRENPDILTCQGIHAGDDKEGE